MQTDVAASTARLLLEVGAVTLSPQAPYTWASGIKSPIYCDNRLLMSYPKARARVAADLAALLGARHPEVDVLAATATGAIPHAAWVAQLLELPMVFVRSEPKAHGKRNLVEGRLETGKRVVVVEDTVSTGSSCRRTVAAVRAEGGVVLGVVAIFSYGFAATKAAFDGDAIPFVSLTDFRTLVRIAHEQGMIAAAEIELLAAWQREVGGLSMASDPNL